MLTKPKMFDYNRQRTGDGNKTCNRAALLDFTSVIGPNGSNAECETCHFSLKMNLQSYICFFNTVNIWGKGILGHHVALDSSWRQDD